MSISFCTWFGPNKNLKKDEKNILKISFTKNLFVGFQHTFSYLACLIPYKQKICLIVNKRFVWFELKFVYMKNRTRVIKVSKPHYFQSTKCKLNTVLFNIEKSFGNNWRKFISFAILWVEHFCARQETM